MNDQTDRVIEYIRLLSIFYFVAAGITALCGSFPLIHAGMGMMMIADPAAFGNDPPPPAVGALFAAIGLGVVLLAWALALAMVFAGLSLREYRRRTFVLVVAGLACMNFPFGTALGVFTFVTLLKPEAEELFRHPPGSAPLPLPDVPPAS